MIVLITGVAVGGLYFGLDALLSQKLDELHELKEEASGTVEIKAVQDRQAQNKRIIKLEKENATLEAFAKKVEAFWPQKQEDIISFEDITSDLSKLSDAGAKGARGKPKGLHILNEAKVEPRELVYSVDDASDSSDSASAASAAAPAGGSGGSTSSTDLEVKYKEFGYSFHARGDFGQWLSFLMALDQRRSFYRMRSLSLKSLSSSRLTSRAATLDADFTLNVYQTETVAPKESAQ